MGLLVVGRKPEEPCGAASPPPTQAARQTHPFYNHFTPQLQKTKLHPTHPPPQETKPPRAKGTKNKRKPQNPTNHPPTPRGWSQNNPNQFATPSHVPHCTAPTVARRLTQKQPTKGLGSPRWKHFPTSKTPWGYTPIPPTPSDILGKRLRRHGYKTKARTNPNPHLTPKHHNLPNQKNPKKRVTKQLNNTTPPITPNPPQPPTRI